MESPGRGAARQLDLPRFGGRSSASERGQVQFVSPAPAPRIACVVAGINRGGRRCIARTCIQCVSSAEIRRSPATISTVQTPTPNASQVWRARDFRLLVLLEYPSLIAFDMAWSFTSPAAAFHPFSVKYTL